MSERRQRRKRRRLGRHGQAPEPKGRETPRRGQLPRSGILGYWLRRPEPSVAVASIGASIFLLMTAVTRDRALLVIVLTFAGAGLFVWATWHVWRRNADRWKRGFDDVF